MYSISLWNTLLNNDFRHKIKIDTFDPYNVFLAIATNIPVLLMTDGITLGSYVLLFSDIVFYD